MKTQSTKLAICKKCTCCGEIIYETQVWQVLDNNLWYNCPDCGSTGFMTQQQYEIAVEHLLFVGSAKPGYLD